MTPFRKARRSLRRAADDRLAERAPDGSEHECPGPPPGCRQGRRLPPGCSRGSTQACRSPAVWHERSGSSAPAASPTGKAGREQAVMERASITGAADEPPAPEPTPPSSWLLAAPLYPPPRTRRPVTRAAWPVSSTPACGLSSLRRSPASRDRPMCPSPCLDQRRRPAPCWWRVPMLMALARRRWRTIPTCVAAGRPAVRPARTATGVRHRTSWGGFLRLSLADPCRHLAGDDRAGPDLRMGRCPDQEPDGHLKATLSKLTIPAGASNPNNVATILENEGIGFQLPRSFRYWPRCGRRKLTITGILSRDAEQRLPGRRVRDQPEPEASGRLSPNSMRARSRRSLSTSHDP